MTHSEYAVRMGLDNTPSSVIVANLTRLADRMEVVRSILGNKPIVVTSAYRSHQVNAGVGGSSTSAHMTGNAADFLCPSFGDARSVAKALARRFDRLAFDQIIYEGTWVHIGFSDKPRGKIMTAKFVKGRAIYSDGISDA
jgi:hypothetical protein